MDIENDKAIMFKQPVKLELTYSGQGQVESNPDESEIQNENDILTVTEKQSSDETTQAIWTCCAELTNY